MAGLSRFDPFGDMQRLTEHMLRGYGGEMSGRGFAPAVDIYEDDDSITMKAELPGINPDDVSIDVENQVLTISGERKLEHEDKREGYRRVEQSYGSFSRSFALPESAQTDKVEAEIDNGILKLRIPKQPEVQPKRIQVKKRAEGAESKQVTAGSPAREEPEAKAESQKK
jgi:HSP20 family protein